MIGQETLKTFDELYYKTYSKILKYVVCNCFNIEDVKDIVQNVYLDVYKKLQKNMIINETYIMGIAKNKVKDYYRLNLKVKILSLFSNLNNLDDFMLVDTISSNIDVEKDIMIKDDLSTVWKFLKKKKVIISKIFYLYYYENMNIKGVAKTLNISESNVKNYLYRTLKELKVFMKSRGDKNA